MSMQFLDTQMTLASWRAVSRLRPRLNAAALATHDFLPRDLRFPFHATVLLAGNAKVRQLNNDFRGIDKPTNVLSFPQWSLAELRLLAKRGEPVSIGDIALAYQYVKAEAKNDDKRLIDHVSHLVVHGLLHLFGYDHLTARQAKNMEQLEIAIMRSLGLPDPYLNTGPIEK